MFRFFKNPAGSSENPEWDRFFIFPLIPISYPNSPKCLKISQRPSSFAKNWSPKAVTLSHPSPPKPRSRSSSPLPRPLTLGRCQNKENHNKQPTPPTNNLKVGKAKATRHDGSPVRMVGFFFFSTSIGLFFFIHFWIIICFWLNIVKCFWILI